MTGLLISVRDAIEATTALAGGVDLLDIKEPAHGALGAASPTVWREILSVCGGRVPTSVALGELLEHRAAPDWELLAQFQFAKIGLAGCGKQHDWHVRWTTALRELPPKVQPVAVIYADWLRCQSPPPSEIIHRAVEVPCKAVLFDTHTNTGDSLFSHLTSGELASLIARIRQLGLLVVLGGSLSGDSVVAACELEPDYVAVRGAACRGSRNGPVDLGRVQELADLVRRCREDAARDRPKIAS
jgi:(5-formylfuran-3-yl)methyl phosphate synthase